VNKTLSLPIFGDDGFRDTFGKGLMTIKNIEIFGSAFGKFIKRKKKIKYEVIIANDTRDIGEIIERIIIKYLNLQGINTYSAGVMSTPGLSKIIQYSKNCYGIMITASHNEFKDNGIKLFEPSGYKMKRNEEKIIETLMLTKNNVIFSKIIGEHRFIKNSINFYLSKIRLNFKKKLIDQKVLVDCSNGSMSLVFEKLSKKHKNIILINNKPNGKNINLRCGALEPKRLANQMLKSKINYGVAFDGDGDRVIFLLREYGLIEAEKILYLFADKFKNLHKSFVASEIINFGIVKEFKKSKFKIYISKVGDRNVVDKVRAKRSLIGMEPSGHFHFSNKTNSMDALITFFEFFKLFENQHQLLKKLNSILLFKREIKNLSIKKINIRKESLKKINNLSVKFNERILARQSIWEPTVRIYYDYNGKNNFSKYMQRIKKLI
jgi:phosphoglucosamine mutase